MTDFAVMGYNAKYDQFLLQKAGSYAEAYEQASGAAWVSDGEWNIVILAEGIAFHMVVSGEDEIEFPNSAESALFAMKLAEDTNSSW